MDQPIQQAIENKLPIKTKIAAYWIIGLGLIGIGRQIKHIFWNLANPNWHIEKGSLFRHDFELVLFLVLAIFLLLLGILIIEKRKYAVYVAINIFLIISICLNVFNLYSFFEYPGFTHYYGLLIWCLVTNVIFLTPLVLLLLDRKNFWKVAR